METDGPPRQEFRSKSSKDHKRRFFWSNGKFVEYMAVITAASSLLVIFEPFHAPFDIHWGDIHLFLGLVLLASLPVHFFAKRRACAYMSKKR